MTDKFAMRSKRIFLIKLIVIAIINVFIVPELFLASGIPQIYILNSNDVYRALRKSKSHMRSRFIILGDSVGRQLYDIKDISDKYDSVTSNQAISMVGQYILLKNIISNNHDIAEVDLIYHPHSFTNDLDQIYTLDYFIKPFYTTEYMQYISDTSRMKIQKIPNLLLSHFPIIKCSSFSLPGKSIERSDNIELPATGLMPSELSMEYLRKIKDCATKNKIRFRVISPILNETWNSIDFSKFKNIIKKNDLDDVFAGYFNFTYSPKENFVDMFHYKKARMFGDDPLKLYKE